MCLIGFAVNDKFKLIILDQKSLAESLKNLTRNGNDVEKYFALELIAQLAFNAQISKKINNDQNWFAYINDLLKKNELKYKRLKKSCPNMLWILSRNTDADLTTNKSGEINDKLKEKLNLNKPEKDHIMISYNTGSRDLCIQIKM